MDEVEQRHAAPDVALGDRHDEPEVRFGELAPGELAVALHAPARLGALRLSREPSLGAFDRRASRVASSPASMRLASVTSCSAVSSGTLPISLRYMRTGSKLPPSLCVTRAATRTDGELGVGVSSSADARAAAPGRGAVVGPVLTAVARVGGAPAFGGDDGVPGAALVFELQLFGDLVEHLDAARLEHVPEVAQLVGVGLEIGERGEDLTGRDEAALADLVEHAADVAVVRRRRFDAPATTTCSARCVGLSRSTSVESSTRFGLSALRHR